MSRQRYNNYDRNNNNSSFQLHGTAISQPPTSLSNESHSNSKSSRVRSNYGPVDRFHGAFTGGWSAGHFNTVGSKEGWKPREINSSTSTNANDRSNMYAQSIHDFMDDEDEQHELDSSSTATVAQSSSTATALRSTAQTSNNADRLLEQEMLRGLTGARQSIGMSILSKYGYKHGDSIGPIQFTGKRSKAKIQSTKLQSQSNKQALSQTANRQAIEISDSESSTSQDDDDDEDDAPTVHFQFDEAGLGFDSSQLTSSSIANSSRRQLPNHDSDDERAIMYDNDDDMSQYDIESKRDRSDARSFNKPSKSTRNPPQAPMPLQFVEINDAKTGAYTNDEINKRNRLKIPSSFNSSTIQIPPPESQLSSRLCQLLEQLQQEQYNTSRERTHPPQLHRSQAESMPISVSSNTSSTAQQQLQQQYLTNFTVGETITSSLAQFNKNEDDQNDSKIKVDVKSEPSHRSQATSSSRSRLVGFVKRSVCVWRPAKLLCKRLGLAEPKVDDSIQHRLNDDRHHDNDQLESHSEASDTRAILRASEARLQHTIDAAVKAYKLDINNKQTASNSKQQQGAVVDSKSNSSIQSSLKPSSAFETLLLTIFDPLSLSEAERDSSEIDLTEPTVIVEPTMKSEIQSSLSSPSRDSASPVKDVHKHHQNETARQIDAIQLLASITPTLEQEIDSSSIPQQHTIPNHIHPSRLHLVQTTSVNSMPVMTSVNSKFNKRSRSRWGAKAQVDNVSSSPNPKSSAVETIDASSCSANIDQPPTASIDRHQSASNAVELSDSSSEVEFLDHRQTRNQTYRSALDQVLARQAAEQTSSTSSDFVFDTTSIAQDADLQRQIQTKVEQLAQQKAQTESTRQSFHHVNDDDRRRSEDESPQKSTQHHLKSTSRNDRHHHSTSSRSHRKRSRN